MPSEPYISIAGSRWLQTSKLPMKVPTTPEANSMIEVTCVSTSTGISTALPWAAGIRRT